MKKDNDILNKADIPYEVRLLDENDIIYCPMDPADEKNIMEVENAVDINAVRIPQDLKQKPKINKVEI